MDNRYRILLITFFSMFVFGMVLQSIPPVLARLIVDMNLSHTQGGLLMSLFALPGIILSLPGGMLADYYGPRKVGIISLLLMLAGTLIVASASTFAMLALGRFVTGIGATTIVIVSAQALSRGFMNKKLGIAMGVFNAGVPAGTIFAHNFFSRALIIWDWRMPILFTTLACLVMLVFFWKFSGFPDAVNNKQEINKSGDGKSRPTLSILESLQSIRQYRAIWMVATAWMLFIAARVSSLTFAPDYFISIGYQVSYAGFLASLFTMGSLVISPLIGHFIDKTGRSESYLVAGGVILAVLYSLIAVALTGHLLLALFIGIAAAIMPVSIFSLVPRLLPVEKMGMGYGVLRICENIGMLMGPFLIGLSFDLSGAYFYGFLLMAFFSLGASVNGLLLKIYQGKG